MAASKRRLPAAFLASRKLVVITAGLLVLLGASGTAALVVSGPSPLISKLGGGGDQCKTLYQAQFERSGESRVIAIIRSGDVEPRERVKTGLRLAMHLAETLRPDLVTVQMTGRNGPNERAGLRGAAIGAEIALAPNPNRTRATDRNWEVRYVDAAPTEHGYFYGPRANMKPDEIEALSTSIAAIAGCDGDAVKTASATPVVVAR